MVASVPVRFTVYYGKQRYLLLAPTFVLAPANPYRPPSPMLLLGCKQPFQIERADGSILSARAALLAPKLTRRRLLAVESDLAIFALPIRWSITADPVQVLELERFSAALPMLGEAFGRKLSCAEVDRLFEKVLHAIADCIPTPLPLDPRIEHALRLIDELPFDEAKLTTLARRVSLSPSRLRHLFKEVTGNTVSDYARWAAIWRVMWLWSQGRRLTEIAHEVGFHDLAHLDHAFIEVFGLNPSSVINPEHVTLIRCP